MKSTKEINERKSTIMDAIAKRGPLLLKDIHPHFERSRQTIQNYLEDLVEAGCLREITVTEEMREENNLSSGAGPFYAVDEENLDNCTFLSDPLAEEIRENSNKIRNHMKENGLIRNPSTEKIKVFLEEFMWGGKFEDSDEIDLDESEISSEGLSIREYQEFHELWFKVMASDPDWNIDVEMNISPKNSEDDHPDILLLQTAQDFEDYMEEN